MGVIMEKSFLAENDIGTVDHQVFYRAVYEYRVALNEYAMSCRMRLNIRDSLIKVYLLGRILGNTAAEIDCDIDEGSAKNHD